MNNLDNVSKRDRLYRVWATFKGIKFDLSELTLQIRKHYTPMYIFVGKYDEIIKPAYLKTFLSKSKRYEYFELEANHNTILDASMKKIEEIINVNKPVL